MKSKAYFHSYLMRSIGKFSKINHRKWFSLLKNHRKKSYPLSLHGFYLLLLVLFARPLSLPPSTLPSPPFHPSLTFFEVHRLFTAAYLFIAGSLHLLLCPPPPSFFAVWSSCCLLVLAKAVELKAIQFGDSLTSPSHALDPLLCITMASVDSNALSLSVPTLGPGFYDALRFLLKTVSGIEEGSLQGLPWQVLPLIRSVVKERLALATFSPCSCSFLTISQTITTGSGFLSGNRGSSSVLGCRCTGWQEGAVGTLICGRSDDSLLHKELLVLRFCCNNLLASDTPAQAVQSQFARFTLSSEADKMAQAGENSGIADIKKNLRRLYELLSISVMDNREMARDVKKMEDTVSYTSLQISNHDA